VRLPHVVIERLRTHALSQRNRKVIHAFSLAVCVRGSLCFQRL
jgi:hypothetical protein